LLVNFELAETPESQPMHGGVAIFVVHMRFNFGLAEGEIGWFVGVGNYVRGGVGYRLG
jgi:hypothetical protein